MSAAPDTYISVEEYLDLERRAERKAEYYQGRICLMAGASVNHNLIVANLIAAVHGRTKGTPCRVFPSDLRVKCPSGLYTYPDAIIVCGERDLEDKHRDTLLNPTVLFEVLPPSTETYDRGAKFDHYRAIPSLQEYVLIAPDQLRIEHYQRDDNADRWTFLAHHEPAAILRLKTGDVSIPLNQIYANVELDEPRVELRTIDNH